jgi:hypothetical protein
VFVPIHAGTRLYGRVERCGPSCIATLFIHVWFVPLIPLRSFLILEEHGDGTFESIPLRLHTVSTLTGLAALVVVAAAVAAALHPFTLGPIAMLVAFAMIIAVAFGRLTPTERTQRQIYAEFAGHPIDVALLPEGQRQDLHARLQHELQSRARTNTTGGTPYRDPGFGLDPDETNPHILGAALTLARLDRDRKSHDRIWRKLRPELKAARA